jgi:DNA-binding protein H-NS
MTELMEKILALEKILASKRAERERVAALPIEEKLVILEKLRDQARALRLAATSVKNSRGRAVPGSALE